MSRGLGIRENVIWRNYEGKDYNADKPEKPKSLWCFPKFITDQTRPPPILRQLNHELFQLGTHRRCLLETPQTFQLRLPQQRRPDRLELKSDQDPDRLVAQQMLEERK